MELFGQKETFSQNIAFRRCLRRKVGFKLLFLSLSIFNSHIVQCSCSVSSCNIIRYDKIVGFLKKYFWLFFLSLRCGLLLDDRLVLISFGAKPPCQDVQGVFFNCSALKMTKCQTLWNSDTGEEQLKKDLV